MNGSSSNRPRILLGGVPFGRDNVGDEAILECIVNIIREVCPHADIAASTADQEATAKKLGIRTYPLFGFETPVSDDDEMRHAIENNDVFIWSGATGLSDYPDIPLQMLSLAQTAGKKTAIFCTGMNTELNPYLYKLQLGRRKQVYNLISSLTIGSVDLTRNFEEKRRNYTKKYMRKTLSGVDLIVLRDLQSLEVIENFIDPRDDIVVGADPAIELSVRPITKSSFKEPIRKVCQSSKKKIGLCLSSQSPVKQLGGLAQTFERLFEKHHAILVGIPMNPITDAKFMATFAEELTRPENLIIAEGRFEPDEIAGLISEMDVVVSSRLHLLILASITNTPFIGISRGSKVTNFTSQFGLPDIGSVDSIDMISLESELASLIENRSQFEHNCKSVRSEMAVRLANAKKKLSLILDH